jgi:hypothetical protein
LVGTIEQRAGGRSGRRSLDDAHDAFRRKRHSRILRSSS